jgi:hypothetical protein
MEEVSLHFPSTVDLTARVLRNVDHGTMGSHPHVVVTIRGHGRIDVSWPFLRGKTVVKHALTMSLPAHD